MAIADKFNRASDYTKYALLLGASYAAHLPFMYYMRDMSLNDMALAGCVIGGLVAATRAPYLKRVPIRLFKIFSFASSGKTSTPSQQILDDVEELRTKYGIREQIKTFILESKDKNNAHTDGIRIYLGRDLVDKLSRAELKFIIAHEMGHIARKDTSEMLPFMWPLTQTGWALLAVPFHGLALVLNGLLNSLPGGPEAYTTRTLPDSTESMAYIATVMTLAYAHSALSNSYSRVIERRTDRNAVLHTGDPEAAITALLKIDEYGFKPENRFVKLFYSHPPTDERIKLIAETYGAGNLIDPRHELTAPAL